MATDPAIASSELLRRARLAGFTGGKSALYALAAAVRSQPSVVPSAANRLEAVDTASAKVVHANEFLQHLTRAQDVLRELAGRVEKEVWTCRDDGAGDDHGSESPDPLVDTWSQTAERDALDSGILPTEIPELPRLPEPSDGLSRREQQVARLLVAGYTAVNAAAITGLTENTVRTYVRRVYLKLGVMNRADLVRTLLGVEGAPPSPIASAR